MSTYQNDSFIFSNHFPACFSFRFKVIFLSRVRNFIDTSTNESLCVVCTLKDAYRGVVKGYKTGLHKEDFQKTC